MDYQAAPARGVLSPEWPPWRALIPRAFVRNALGFCLFGLGYYGAYYNAMAFSPAVSAPFWLPDSVLLCGLLCLRSSRGWVLLVTILPIRLLVATQVDVPAWFLAAVYVNDCVKATLGAYLLRRFVPDPIRFGSIRDFGVYCALIVLLLPLLSAFGGAAARASLGHDYWQAVEQWFFGDAAASLIVTPVIFYWVLRPPNPMSLRGARVIEAGILTVGLLVSLSLAFESGAGVHDFGETRYYAPLVFIFWAAMRFGMLGATGAVALLATFAVNAAIDGSGSFAALSPQETSSRLQHFLLLRAAPLYLAAVLLEHMTRVDSSLRESEQRFRTMADSAPVLIWMSGTDARCEFFNQGWLKFTGRALADELGDGWAKGVHLDDIARCLEVYRRSFEQRLPFEMDYRLRRHDGEYRWIVDLGVPRYDSNGVFLGYLGSAIDVTERRNAKAALERSESRYREVVENMTGYVCRLLPDTTLKFVNSAYCSFLGKPREELLGAKLLSLMPESAREAAAEAINRAASGFEHGTWECEVAHPDGTRGWQHWVCNAIAKGPGDAPELQVVGQDVTDRKSAEESGRRLAHATRFAAVGQLSAMVAHEINQPLCAILSNAEAAEIMLRSDSPPLDEIRAIIADIREDDLRADAAIRSIRSLLHRRELEPSAVDIAATIRHVLKLTAGDALHRRVPVRHEIAPDLPLASAVPSQLEQVLVILIANGMDAMKDTEESKRELVVMVRRGDVGMVEVSVRDRGHGIPQENMGQLFDSFFTTKPDGMGLGLSIARSMIEAHGGRICAQNVPGGGAIFRFSMRAHEQSEPSHAIETGAPNH